MKKKITALTCGLLCGATLIAGAFAAGAIKEIRAELRSDFIVKIDGDVTRFKNAQGERVYPILYEGTTYLPLRAVGELMGKTVYWNEQEKLIELKDDDDKKTTVTDADVFVNSEEKIPQDKVNPEKVYGVDDFIGGEKAKQLALKKAGLNENEVIFENVELDKERGIWIYDVEFRQGRNEYDIDVNAVSGEIVSFEKDIDD